VAGAYADPWYDYGYDPAYSGYGDPYSYGDPAYDYSYGYPAYSYYGYGDPAEQVVVRRPPGSPLSPARNCATRTYSFEAGKTISVHGC
jgi:hypothetical protein